MDIERGPVIDDAILRQCHGDDSDFRMLAKQGVADPWSFSWMVETDHHKIRRRLSHALENLRLFFDFANNFNVRLVGKSRQDGFAHQARMVRHKDPDGLFHGTLPCKGQIFARVSKECKNQKWPSCFVMTELVLQTKRSLVILILFYTRSFCCTVGKR